MSEINSTPDDLVVRSLARSLYALDCGPPNRRWADKRSEADRDEARAIAAKIREMMPLHMELAGLCVRVWAQVDPSMLGRDTIFYHGPDVFRCDEDFYGYPDDSGVDTESEEWKSWPDRNGLSESADNFSKLAGLFMAEARHAAARAKKEAGVQRRESKARRQVEIDSLLRNAVGV